MKLWCPRFTVRTLAIVMTLVCIYFGVWEATKRYAVPKKLPFVALRWIDRANMDGFVTTIRDAWSPAPFIVACTEEVHVERGPRQITRIENRYYLWLFRSDKLRLPMPYIEQWLDMDTNFPVSSNP